MKINLDLLNTLGACQEGKEWFISKNEESLSKIISLLIKDEKFEWGNWLLVRLFSQQQNVLYACYSAKLSLKYFEKQFPKDKRPRLAIQAAIKWAKNPTKVNKSAASAARSAASAAAAWSAASESAAASAAWSESAAESATSAARSAAWKKILKYGLSLLLKGVLCK